MKKRLLGLLLACVLLLGLVPAASAAADQTCTVTANLMVPGELNTQLPGVTAYMTNGNNPLGLGGYEAKAPTEPVYNNASAVLAADGTLTLTVPIPNPVFTLQKIGSCSNAKIISAPRDSQTYRSTDGSASRQGRITSLTVELLDRSGTYVFSDCVEFPTLLGVDWTVPLTLNVDLSAVPKTPQQSPSQSPTADVNYDKLNAMITTVKNAKQTVSVSADGKDVSPSKTWVTQADMDALNKALSQAKSTVSGKKDQNTVDAQSEKLNDAYQSFLSAQKSGKGQATDHLGKTLKPGTYTISANIWFNKADTGLPLNPHITNSTFPPMNPVEGNAKLTVKKDGSAAVVIPVCIKDRVMTVREINGLSLTDTQKNSDGAITEITVELDKLTGDSTVVTMQGEKMTADIWMGDLAMTISGLDKEHTWPFTFELNLSGVATTDGGKMPKVELEMLDSSAASGVLAAAGVSGEAPDKEPEETEAPAGESKTESNAGLIAVAVAVAAAAVAVAAGYAVRHKKKESKQ